MTYRGSINILREAGNHWSPFPANRTRTGRIRVLGRIVDGMGPGITIHMNKGKGAKVGDSYPGSPDRVVEIDLTVEQAEALGKWLIEECIGLRTSKP